MPFFHLLSLSYLLAYHDIRGRYIRSIIGPFWLTISMTITALCIGLVFGVIFKAPMKEFLPFVILGLAIWTFITGLITDSCSSFIESNAIIKQLPIPLYVFVMRSIWRNLFIFFHNILIFPLILLFFQIEIKWTMLLVIPGLTLSLICLLPVGMILAIFCSRFRDLQQIISSILQIVFYMTPIIWLPSMITSRIGHELIHLNPFFHLIELSRAPLLGEAPGLMAWWVILLFSILNWIIILIIYQKFKHRIPYWL